MNFAEKIKIVRMCKEISQVEFARLLHDHGLRTTQVTVSRWESGVSVPRQSTLAIISQVLGVPFGDTTKSIMLRSSTLTTLDDLRGDLSRSDFIALLLERRSWPERCEECTHATTTEDVDG